MFGPAFIRFKKFSTRMERVQRIERIAMAGKQHVRSGETQLLCARLAMKMFCDDCRVTSGVMFGPPFECFNDI